MYHRLPVLAGDAKKKMFHSKLPFFLASHCGWRGETQGNITLVGPLNKISPNHHLKAIKRSLLHNMISLWWTFYYTGSSLLKLPRQSHMVQTNNCLITKKPSCSSHVLAVLPQTTWKIRLGPGNPSLQPLSMANPVPVFPGGCLALAGSLRVAKQQCEHCCARVLCFAFILTAITRIYTLTKIGGFLPPAQQLGKTRTYFR